MSDIFERLADLHQQATTEQSHYYVAKCCRDAMREIEVSHQRINELIAERDDAKEKLIEVQKKISWECAVCDFPMKRIEDDRWTCFHCEEVSRLQVEINKLKGMQ